MDASAQTDAAREEKFDFGRNVEEVRGLGNDEGGWKRAGELHELFGLWERAVSDGVHEAMYGTVERRLGLRRYVWGEKSPLPKPPGPGEKEVEDGKTPGVFL